MIKIYYSKDDAIIKKAIGYDNTFSSLTFDTHNLISSINTVDFFNPVTNYLVYVDELNIDDIHYVTSKINSDTNNVFFTLSKEPTKSQISKMKHESLNIEILETDETSITNLLIDYTQKEGISIEPHLVEKLSIQFFHDINTVINELAKLHAFSQGKEITKADINLITTTVESNNIFELVELFVTNRNKEAFVLFDSLVSSGYSEIALLETMYAQTRFLIQVECLKFNNANSIASVLKANEYRVKFTIRLLKDTNKNKLFTFFDKLANTEYKAKRGLLQAEDIKYSLIII